MQKRAQIKAKSLPSGPYQPGEAEPSILRGWLNRHLFKPEYDPATRKVRSISELKGALKTGNKKAFSLVDPPPNAYMLPHTGNVSGYAYQDLMGRFARMNGQTVFLQPGKDHAGIQGEIVVLREYFKPKGVTKDSISRDEFYAQTYSYFLDVMKGAQQSEQRIGLSADFDRDVFTLDPDIVHEVLTTFTKMYDDDLVYKGVRLVNWCPTDQTALADIDTEKHDRQSTFEYIHYPLLNEGQRVWRVESKSSVPSEATEGDIVVIVDIANHQAAEPFILGKSGSLESWSADKHPDRLTVATTRPETMVGDTAVVVNPKDKRYTKILNRQVLLPLAWRVIPIIIDEQIDIELGTGALKLTPAHAPEDYEIMLRWNSKLRAKSEEVKGKSANEALHSSLTPLSYINVIDKHAKLTGPVGRYFGMGVEEAKQSVLDDLKKHNLWEKSEAKEQQVAVCERCGSVIEPIMSSQWFIKVDPLRKPAIDVVKNNEIVIHPKYMAKKYLHWMENLRDWPISRSLWWGYRMPVWYKGEITETIDEQGQIQETINGKPVADFADAVQQGVAKVSIHPPAGTTITVVRHSESAFSKDDRYTGHNDVSLTESGRKVAHERAAELAEAGYDVIITSPLKRSKETGEIIAQELAKVGQKPQVVEEPLLIERNLGKLGGLTWDEYQKAYPEYAAKSTPLHHPEIPGGESLEDLHSRTQKLVDHIAKKYQGKKVLIVAHKYIMRNLRSILTGTAMEGMQNYEAQYVRGFTSVISDGTWRQDDNVFDTWFSSGQWPYVTLMKWGLLDEFYPTDVMETGYDILELWVSRMIMLGLYRTGKIPFKDVYLHGLVQGPDGQKMSKSKGNVVAPEKVISEYGADTLRLFYIVGNKAGRAYRLTDDKLKGHRNFLNKVWNASRFIIGNLEDFDTQITEEDVSKALHKEDKAMLKELESQVELITKGIETFRFGVVAVNLQQSFWSTLCDTYLEQVKKRLYTKDREGNPLNLSAADKAGRVAAQFVLRESLYTYIRLFHPYIPFITDYIWEHFKHLVPGEQAESLMYAKWPVVSTKN